MTDFLAALFVTGAICLPTYLATMAPIAHPIRGLDGKTGCPNGCGKDAGHPGPCDRRPESR